MDFRIREVRSPQGRKKLAEERAGYFQLMQQGLSNKEACRIVGINPKTGRRWRNGRNASGGNKAAPPIHAVVPPSASSRYLCEADRIHIADRLREKATVRAIAAELGRSPSTVSREIRRNRTDGTRGTWHYRPYAAQARADARRPRPKTRKIHDIPELRDAVQAMLDEKWSPEQ
ncbi:helix-turn-helix domain-containing protein, partial [Streptomyces sp. G-G2]|uniref:helix-turn-helix domain-containing protein n=1 Tax=Streptomyces sp. G-G2 TaxID=3046201 RepID=UPI0024BA3151